MATIVERDVHHVHDASGESSSIATLVVTIVALVVLAGFALFFFRLFPFNGAATVPNDSGSIDVDVDLPTAPGSTTE